MLAAQLITAGVAVEGWAGRSPANKKIHRGCSARWEEGSHTTGNQKPQEGKVRVGFPEKTGMLL